MLQSTRNLIIPHGAICQAFVEFGILQLMESILITGSNRGIGRAFVDLYLAQGYKVFAGVRRLSDALPDSPNLQQVLIDIEDDESIGNAFETIKTEAGSLDILINNAGVSKSTATGDQPESVSRLDALDRSKLLHMFDVNTVSPIIVAKYAVPLMTNPNSFIVNISSLRATYDNSKNGNGNYGYSSSKLALNMMTLCLVHDLPGNISTFAVHPGSVQTDMNPGGSMKPEDSASAISAIIHDLKPELNGKFLNYDGSLLN